MTTIPRREFVSDLAAAGAFTIVPRHVLGRGLMPPSDTLNPESGQVKNVKLPEDYVRPIYRSGWTL